MFWNAAAKGFYDQGEYRNRQRREIAQAFAEFKAQNPEATLEDFQSFIDSQVGNGLGSNYLRGGAPSRDVLTRIAGDNAQRRQRRLRDEALATLRAEGDARGYIQGEMDKFLMNANPDDLENEWNVFLGRFGPNGGDVISGMNLQSSFMNPQYRERLLSDRLLSQMPQIDSYLQMIGYNSEAINQADLARIFGVQERDAGLFVDAARRRADERMHTWTTQNNNEIQRIANEAAAAGRDPRQAVQSWLQGSPYPHLADNFNLDPYVTASEDFVRQRELERENASARVKADLDTAWMGNTVLQNYIRTGNREAGLAEMLRVARLRLNDQDFQKLYGVSEANATAELFAPEYDQYIEALRTSGRGAYDTAYTEMESAISSIRSGFPTENVNNMRDIFKDYFSDQVAGTLAQQFGAMYAASPLLGQAVFRIHSAMPEEIRRQAEENPAAAVDYIGSQLRALGFNPNLEQALDARIESERERRGLYKYEPFQTWYQSETDKLTSEFTQIRQRFDQTLDMYRDNPQALVQNLTRMMELTRAAHEARVAEMESRERSQDRWIEAGTGGWNGEAVANGIVGASQQQTTDFLRLLEETIRDANARIEQSGDGEGADSALPAPPESADGRSELSVWFENFSNEMDRTRELSRVLTDAGMKSSPASALWETAETRAYNGLISDYLQYNGGAYKAYLSRNPEEFARFMQAIQDGDVRPYLEGTPQGREFLQLTGRRSQ